MAEMKASSVIESRYGPLGSGVLSVTIRDVVYTVSDLLFRMGLNFDDSRAIERNLAVKDLGGFLRDRFLADFLGGGRPVTDLTFAIGPAFGVGGRVHFQPNAGFPAFTFRLGWGIDFNPDAPFVKAAGVFVISGLPQ